MAQIMILFDFSKAFNITHYAIFLQKIRSVNCSGAVLNWFYRLPFLLRETPSREFLTQVAQFQTG